MCVSDGSADGSRVSTPWVRLLLGVALMTLAGVAAAHATLVIGELRVSPDPPVPGQPVEVAVALVDPLLVPVEKALVRVELREIDPEDPAVPASITGTEASDFLALPALLGSDYLPEVEAGRYVGTLTAPPEGRYTLSVRDTTFRNEEAIANVGLDVGSDVGSGAGTAANGDVDFVLPPTPIAPRSLSTWLVWIIGIPLAVGALVTVLVLRRGPEPEGGAAAGNTDEP